jgi:hypothetical protein
MARFVKLALAVVVIAVVLLWAIRDEPTTVVNSESGPASTKGGEPGPPMDPVGEIDVSLSRRSTTLGACPDFEDDQSVDELLAEFEAQREQMLRVLEKSHDAEHLMVAALAARPDDADSALMLLGNAAFRDPANPMIASQLLDLCLEIGHCSRARPEMERNLVAADKANVLAWLQVARSRLSRGDEQGALSAMREAAGAAVVDDRLVDYVMTYDRALAASSDLEPYARMHAAFMHAAGVFASETMIFEDCRERVPGSAEWNDLCIRVAERLEQDGRTLQMQSIGLGMQIHLYKLVGDTREQERVMDRHRAFRAQYDPLTLQAARVEELQDATVMRRYLEVLDASGELEAMRYIADEVQARLPPLSGADQQSCLSP